LVPTGLTIARMGDQLVIEREGVAVSTHAIEDEDQVVRKAGDEQRAQGEPQVRGEQPGEELAAAESTPTAEPSDMPMTEHQQQALKNKPGQEQQQTAAAGSADMPATRHQREVLTGGQQGQQEQQDAARTTTAEESDMPMTEHQQEVLKSEPGQDQQQTAPAGATAMPATEHQRQALAEEEMPGEQQQAYELERVEGKPDILREGSVVAPAVQADNGVIHVIDAVLVPQSVLETLEKAEGQG